MCGGLFGRGRSGQFFPAIINHSLFKTLEIGILDVDLCMFYPGLVLVLFTEVNVT